jgi:hypothetical protein
MLYLSWIKSIIGHADAIHIVFDDIVWLYLIIGHADVVLLASFDRNDDTYTIHIAFRDVVRPHFMISHAGAIPNAFWMNANLLIIEWKLACTHSSVSTIVNFDTSCVFDIWITESQGKLQWADIL